MDRHKAQAFFAFLVDICPVHPVIVRMEGKLFDFGICQSSVKAAGGILRELESSFSAVLILPLSLDQLGVIIIVDRHAVAAASDLFKLAVFNQHFKVHVLINGNPVGIDKTDVIIKAGLLIGLDTETACIGKAFLFRALCEELDGGRISSVAGKVLPVISFFFTSARLDPDGIDLIFHVGLHFPGPSGVQEILFGFRLFCSCRLFCCRRFLSGAAGTCLSCKNRNCHHTCC